MNKEDEKAYLGEREAEQHNGRCKRQKLDIYVALFSLPFKSKKFLLKILLLRYIFVMYFNLTKSFWNSEKDLVN